MDFDLEDSVAEEVQFVVCDECGKINGCEHYLLQEQQEISDNEYNTESSYIEPESMKEETIAEMLISFVALRPPLWDHRLPLMNRTKTIKEQLWLEVVSEFEGNTDLSIDILQKKWKNLRDKYIKTKAEVDTYMPSGSGSKKKKKVWKHFHSMAFLSDTVAPRGTVSSWPPLKSNALPSPTESNGSFVESSQPTPKPSRKCKATKDENVTDTILKSIEKICSAPDTNRNQNPICQRISELLNIMPPKEKAAFEIELLKQTYEAAKKYL